MNAYTSKDELGLLASSQVSHSQPGADARRADTGIFARIRAFFVRQATIAELHGLSDRELADIGLHRAQLRDVFSPGFAASRRG